MAQANHSVEVGGSAEAVLAAMPEIFKRHKMKARPPEAGDYGVSITAKEALIGLRLAGNPATVIARIIPGGPARAQVQMESTVWGFALNQVHAEGVLLDLARTLVERFPLAPPQADDPNLPPRVV